MSGAEVEVEVHWAHLSGAGPASGGCSTRSSGLGTTPSGNRPMPLGTGLATPMDALQVSGPDDPPAVLAWLGDPELVADLRLLDLPDRAGHCGALAARTRAPVRLTEHDAGSLITTVVGDGTASW